MQCVHNVHMFEYLCHLRTQSFVLYIQIKQFQVDFDAERKDKQGVAGKLANREREWTGKMRKIEEERDHLKALNMQLQDQATHQVS